MPMPPPPSPLPVAILFGCMPVSPPPPPPPRAGGDFGLFFAFVRSKFDLFSITRATLVPFGTPLNVRPTMSASPVLAWSYSIQHTAVAWSRQSGVGAAVVLSALRFVEICGSARVVTLGTPARAVLVQLSGMHNCSSTSAAAAAGCYRRCPVVAFRTTCVQLERESKSASLLDLRIGGLDASVLMLQK